MIRYLLQFCLTSPENLSPDEREEWGKKWDARLKPLTIWMTSLGDCQVDLTARGMELLELLREAKNNGGGIVVPLDLYEELLDDEEAPLEWFIISPQYMGEFKNNISKAFDGPIRDYRDVLSVKADKMKPGVNISGWFTGVEVSDRFKYVVENHKLTRIEFLWARDIGKYRETQ